MSTIFERLDALEATVNGLNTDITNLRTHLTSVEETVEELINAEEDTGWLSLPLASGIKSYSTNQLPRYRKIGKFVILNGAVKGVTQDRTIIATLPAGFRPSKVVSFVQNMTATSGIANIARWQIQTDGDIEMQYDDYPWEEYDGSEWYPVDVIFAID